MRWSRFAPTTLMVLSLMGSSTPAVAYDLMTHANVSAQSFDASRALRSSLEDLGINATDVFDPDRDLHDPELSASESTAFTLFHVNQGTVRDWLVAGAIREDDYRRHRVLESLFGCPPPPNPQSAQEQIDRPFNHFFDVQRGGTGLAIVGGPPAPDWALGREGRGPSPSQNHFSLPDARVYQIRSLTEESRAERDRNTARLFRTLGQVLHVLQDMAQPQHTRNDPHLGCTRTVAEWFAGEKSWYEIYTETRAKHEVYRSRGDASRPLVLSGYGPVGFQAYGDYWANANGSGLAEFSSRNFFSAGTNLGTFYFAGPCGGLIDPICDWRAYGTEDLDVTVATLGGGDLTGRVRFFLRDIADPLTGEVVENVRTSSRSLWDQHLEASLQRPKFSLNTYIYDAMADLLLPRAVGYSAGLLDYFFRGRLDLDLVSDRTDPSVARLRGTNGSPDALIDGTLTLYADDTRTGRRAAVTPLDPTTVAGVARGGAVTSARFQIPDGAERFVAVYQGTLGNEAKNPDRTLPGAVIGRVLGGVRVEEIFNDGTVWKLRTPRGVFGLAGESGPLSVAQYEVVKWGDPDSMLVARTPLDASRPAVAVFDIPRQPGSSEIDLRAGGTEVVLTLRKSVAFPSTVQLTTVHFTQSIVYRQHVARAEQSTAYVWVPLPPPNPDPDHQGSYTLSGSRFSPFTFELAYEQTIPFSQSFPVMLDVLHNGDIGALFDPYSWYLEDISVDASGRPLGLVSVYLGQPELDPVSAPVFRVNPSGALERYTTRTIWPSFPERVPWLLWALVDLERGVVVASSAQSVVTITSQTADDRIDANCCLGSRTFFVHSTATYSGGPQDGTTDYGWSPAGWAFGGTIGTVTDVTLPANGEQSLSLDGWLREDLRQAMVARGRYTVQPVITPAEHRFVYTCDSTGVCSAMRIHQPDGGMVRYDPGRLFQALRPRPVGGNERLVVMVLSFVDDPSIDAFGDVGDLLVWDPGLARAEFIGPGLPISDYSLASATGSAALVSSFEGSTLFRFDPAQASVFFPDVDLTRSYTLLEPSHLYNTADLKFHRPQPSLETTALPATLADVAGNPTGDYHSIRLVAP